MKRRLSLLLLVPLLVVFAVPVLADHHQMPKATAAELTKGKAIYDQSCGMCHNTGLAGAPKLGDKAAWKEHVKEGLNHLVEAAIKGEGKMPPRGGNAKLTDDEVKAAVHYLVEQSK